MGVKGLKGGSWAVHLLPGPTKALESEVQEVVLRVIVSTDDTGGWQVV